MGAKKKNTIGSAVLRYSVVIANAVFVVILLAIVFEFKEEKQVLELLAHVTLIWIATAILFQCGTYLGSGGA